MLRKRLKGDEDVEADDGEEGKKSSGKKTKDLKISDMDEWMNSSEDDSSENEDEKEEDDDKEEKKKKAKKREYNSLSTGTTICYIKGVGLFISYGLKF